MIIFSKKILCGKKIKEIFGDDLGNANLGPFLENILLKTFERKTFNCGPLFLLLLFI